MATQQNQIAVDENTRKLALSNRLENFGWAVLLITIGTTGYCLRNRFLKAVG